MSNELELECINKIKFFASSIYNYGYSIKLKFLKAKEIDINLLPEDQLKDRLNFVFFNLFEDLLQNGGCFDFEELECISKVFGISINSFVNFMCDFANLSTETILNSYSEGWNKTLFTESICQSVDLATLDEVVWHEMLDWEYLTANLPVADIKSNINKYADKWNHIVFANRVTGKELLADKFLETYAEVISEQNLTKEIWPVITCKFPANELISLVEEYSDEQYRWDYAHMYELADFPAKEYIEQHTENVRWAEFSASAAANRLFSKTGANKTQSLWLRIYEDMLNNDGYQWDFNKLTKQPNILKLPKLFLLKKEWDWEYISEHAIWISAQEGKDYYFKLFVDLLDFGKLSHRTDIELTEKVIEQYDKKKQWDWNALVQNESINFSFEYIDKHEDKPWNWHSLAHREGLPFDVVLSHKEKDWDWHYLSTLDIFVPSVDLLTYLAEHDYEIDWNSVSENKELTKIVGLTGNDLETSGLLYSAMFCTNQKNAFLICKSSVFLSH